MSRQLEQVQEERTARRNKEIVKAVEYDLVGSIGHAGGELTGFSVRIGATDTLLTLRAIVAGRPQIAFVGGSDTGSCLIKACSLGRQDRLQWKADRFAREGG